MRLAAPQRIERGKISRIGLSFEGMTPAAIHIFHVHVLNPANEIVSYFSGNLLASGGVTQKLPMAQNEKQGQWILRAKDLISGQELSAHFEVF